jgi:esterase
MAADVAGLMDRLELPRAHVLGMSMGGRIAMALALAEPARVNRLVLIDGGHLAPLLTRHERLVAEVSAFLTESA